MAKKHFEAIAEALKARKPNDNKDVWEGEEDYFNGLISQWRGDCEAMADVLAEFNDQFDRARFLAACGVE